jgi:hypothetical protein
MRLCAVLSIAMNNQVFRVGDMIRITSIPDSARIMPPDLSAGPHDTLAVFEKLLKEKLVHRVVEVDADCGWPWIEFEIPDANHGQAYHKLMIEPDCVKLVIP